MQRQIRWRLFSADIKTNTPKGVTIVFTREIHLSRETVQDFVSEASKCKFDVDLGYNRVIVDAKSIMGVFSLDLTKILTVRYPLKDDNFEIALNRFALN